MYHSSLFCLSANGHLGRFHVLAIVNSAAGERWGTCVCFTSGFLGVSAQQWDYWVTWQFYSLFLKESHTVLHSGYTSLHSHQLCNRVPPPPQPIQHLLFVDFLMVAVLTGVITFSISIHPFIDSCLQLLFEAAK